MKAGRDPDAPRVRGRRHYTTWRGRPTLTGAPPLDLRGWHVYTLHDPDTGVARYVGVTEKPRIRWYMHVSVTRYRAKKGRATSPVALWVLELFEQGKRPEMRLVAPAPDEETGKAMEVDEIRRRVAAGEPLLNVLCREAPTPPTCGRCGMVGHKRTSCKRKKKTSADYSHEIRMRRREAGLCWFCNGTPEPGFTLCNAHRSEHRANGRKKQEAKVRDVGGRYRCTACGELGHNRRSCARASEAA